MGDWTAGGREEPGSLSSPSASVALLGLLLAPPVPVDPAPELWK